MCVSVEKVGSRYWNAGVYVLYVCVCLYSYVVCVPLFRRTEEQEALPIPSGPVYVSNFTRREIQLHTKIHTHIHMHIHTCTPYHIEGKHKLSEALNTVPLH